MRLDADGAHHRLWLVWVLVTLVNLFPWNWRRKPSWLGEGVRKWREGVDPVLLGVCYEWEWRNKTITPIAKLWVKEGFVLFDDDYCYYLFLSIWSSPEGIKNGGTAVGENINQYRQYGKQFLKEIKRKLPYNPAIPVLGIYCDKAIIQKHTYTPVFIAALFTITKTRRQPNVNQQMNG